MNHRLKLKSAKVALFSIALLCCHASEANNDMSAQVSSINTLVNQVIKAVDQNLSHHQEKMQAYLAPWRTPLDSQQAPNLGNISQQNIHNNTPTTPSSTQPQQPQQIQPPPTQRPSPPSVTGYEQAPSSGGRGRPTGNSDQWNYGF